MNKFHGLTIYKDLQLAIANCESKKIDTAE